MILIFKLGVRQKHRAITVLDLDPGSWVRDLHPRRSQSCHWNSEVMVARAASPVGDQSCSRHSEYAGMVRCFLLFFEVSNLGCLFNYCESDHKPQFYSKSFKYILETAATKLPEHLEWVFNRLKPESWIACLQERSTFSAENKGHWVQRTLELLLLVTCRYLVHESSQLLSSTCAQSRENVGCSTSRRLNELL